MVPQLRKPISNVSVPSDNTLNIIQSLQEHKFIYNANCSEKIPLKEAIKKGFVHKGLGLYKNSFDTSDYGKIWVRKTIIDNKTGKKEDWLVVYTSDDGNEIIRNLSSEYIQKQASLYKTSFDTDEFKKYPEYRKYFIFLSNLSNMPWMYSRFTISEKGSKMLEERFPELDSVEANKIVNLWLGTVNPNNSKASLLKKSVTTNPKDIPIAPGIKSKNLNLDESGGTGTGKVTIEFTDPDKALDFYNNKVMPSSEENKEVPEKQVSNVPVNQSPQTQNIPSPQQPITPSKESNLLKHTWKDSMKEGKEFAEDSFGQHLYPGDVVREGTRRGTVVDNFGNNNIKVKWDDGVTEIRVSKDLTKWANLKSTVFEFSDGIKGIKVFKHSKKIVYSTYNPLEIVANQEFLSSPNNKERYFFINEKGIMVPVTLRKGIKIGEMFERPDIHELVRFAGWEDRIEEDEYDNDNNNNDNDNDNDNEVSLDIHIKSDPETVEEIFNKLLEIDEEDFDTEEDYNNTEENFEEDELEGGEADYIPDEEFDEEELDKGIEEEMEHTDDEELAKEIAKDHLQERRNKGENEDYYEDLEEMEDKNKEESKHNKNDFSKEKNKKTKSSSLEPIFSKIVHRKDGWHVLSEKNKHLGGPYSSKKEAEKRLRQVEYFKHKGNLDKEAVSPPGWKGTVEHMKEHEDKITNPWQLSWYMEEKGYKPHYTEEGTKKEKYKKKRGPKSHRKKSAFSFDFDEYNNSNETIEIGDNVKIIDPTSDFYNNEGIVVDKVGNYDFRVTINNKDYYFYKDEITKVSFKTAADSDDVPPLSVVNDNSKTDIEPVSDKNQPALPQNPNLKDQPGDVLYDSDQGEKFNNKFQVTTDPKNKTVTVKFIDEDKEDVLNKYLGINNTENQTSQSFSNPKNPKSFNETQSLTSF